MRVATDSFIHQITSDYNIHTYIHTYIVSFSTLMCIHSFGGQNLVFTRIISPDFLWTVVPHKISQ